MPNVKFECVITCTKDATLSLDGVQVPLHENGVTKSGEATVAAGATVHIHATLEGVIGSPWSLALTPSCPGSQPPKLWSRSGLIPEGGGLILNGDAKVPDDPCASKDGLELARLMMPESEFAPKVSAKKSVKKAGRKKTN